MSIDSNIILDMLGNDTRRRILGLLSEEPMYFNQLAKEIGVGQQAVLRHMNVLEENGLIETYRGKSDLGAPDRKYYKLGSSFILTISLSADEFSITNQNIIELRRNESRKYYKALDTIPEDTVSAISSIQEGLFKIDKEIYDMELRLSDLKALRQLILHRLHEIGIDNFEKNEREVLYRIVKESPKSVLELSKMLDEKESVLSNILTGMRTKTKDEDNERVLFEDLR